MSSLETVLISKFWFTEAAKAFSSKPYNERKFTACFGASSLFVNQIWTHCRIGMKSEKLQPKHLLWTLYWMKVYPTEDVAMVTFSIGSRNTLVRKLNLTFGVLDKYLPEVHIFHLILLLQRISAIILALY